ncbi:AraC-type DNA-binding protein [Dyadobacter sp. SG02]|uniref:helix-turn-helix transcriptional regulator n=1 Tax=Dyadobacter sp. SG02 TaxID=1855291 RepID=UPI0008CD6215|nr:AraC family transcriptional regulator [Dyadobacter sp. SG02]SEI50656.1 AraC-type DNA-binding protein [Dyadobacter sp. SG02]
MATAVINSADVFRIDSFPNPQLLRPEAVLVNRNEIDICQQTEVGTLKFRSLLFPDMHVMNLHWQVGRDVSIVENSPADTVNINFQMSGRMNTRFTGISGELVMNPRQHNLIFSPEGGFRNNVKAGEQVEMFHISIGKRYFSELIGCDDRWSERAQKAMANESPFAGKERNPDVTPYMMKVIRDIKQCSQTGAIRNLLVQSKVLELLALQLGQMQDAACHAPGLNAAEIGRLHELKTFLDAHFLEDFSLSKLGRICLLNEFKLKKGFKELFGTTIFSYLRKLRMDFAAQLLLNTSKSIEDISRMLGYEHPQHFSTAFKGYHGSKPSDFRHRSQAFQPLTACHY